MTKYELGQLEKVELRTVWETEAGDFTPWLASEENLKILGDTISIDLELEAQEKSVGPFRADILCKDKNYDSWVLIENQLERSDHTHLGQLMTYASGLQAVSIVWIASNFTEEHRSTLDWLNQITDESFRFFGIEIELWRIGDSHVAPKFNIVSKPNNWTRSVSKAAKAIEEADLTETRLLQREYWNHFHIALQNKNGPISGNRKAQPQSWMSYSIGRTGFTLGASMQRHEDSIRAELYIGNEDAKSYFKLLRKHLENIHEELGYELDWQELPEKRDCRIAIALSSTNVEQNEDWPRQHDWLASKINDLHRVFSRRVKALDLTDINSLDN